MKKLFLFVIWLTVTIGAGAVPAKRVERVLTLTDGTQLRATD